MVEPCPYPHCKRIKGHKGCHTQYPVASTFEWDMKQREDAILAYLDFETPYWANILDP